MTSVKTPASGKSSAELWERALTRTPGGVQSNVRLTGGKAFIKRAAGAWMWSVDGEDFVDYLLGQGPNFLGHAPERVLAAVSEACRDGLIYGGEHPLEVEAAEAICDALGWADMVRFGSTGTEVVQAALRLARAATGRNMVVRFEGHYHGWLDNVLIALRDDNWGPASAGQIANQLGDFFVLPWNDSEALGELLAASGTQVAAVIMEPVMMNAGAIEPLPGYLQRVRQLCDEHGIVLIFDEVISGFRVDLGGAVQRYGVVPNLATYGKAMAGGWPVSALAGDADLMALFGNGQVNHSGTFNGSVMAMAATVATLGVLRDDPPYPTVREHGLALMEGIRGLGQRHGVQLHLQGLPAAFHVSFGDAEVTDYRTLQKLDLARYRAFSRSLIEHGIWVADRGIWYVSASHGPRELDAALGRFDRTLQDWG
jgi:glutamate-1-semialdehyde 2,1-aminomutase